MVRASDPEKGKKHSLVDLYLVSGGGQEDNVISIDKLKNL